MDLFEKCRKYTLANEFREMGIYPYFHALESRQDVEVIMEGKRRIMLGSNNCLLYTSQQLVAAGHTIDGNLILDSQITLVYDLESCLLYTSK